MRYLALAVDYDGTLAHHGTVSPNTVEALKQLAATGRKLILVTGRELEELLGVFAEIDLFDRVVAENGALLYRPAACGVCSGAAAKGRAACRWRFDRRDRHAA